MAVREFDGTDDDIVTAIGALSEMTYGAVAAIIKVDDTATLKTILGLHDLVASAQLSIGNDVSEFGYWWVHGSERVEDQQLTAGTWYVYVVRKGTGNLVPRSSLYNFSTATWNHFDSNNDVIDATSPGVGGDTRLSAGGSNFFSGRVAIRAAWSNSVGPADAWTTDATGDAAIEAAGLETAASNWDAENPSAGWLFNQSATSENVTDFTGGGADQTSITGTTVITGDDPPGFSFDLSGGTVGTASGSFGYSGTVTGQATAIGAAAGSYGYTGTATGQATALGAASGSYAYSGTASGLTTVIGSASGSYGYTGTVLGTGEATEAEPIVLPPFREPAVPDFQESAVPSFRETKTPAFQEAS